MHRVHPDAEEERDEVVGPDRGDPHHVDVDERLARAKLDGDPADDEDDRERRRARSPPASAHPQVGASLTPTSRATSQPESSTAASQSIRPGVRTGDSGTNAHVQIAGDHDRCTSGIQNSQW